jgi:microcystin-dependent protein
MSEPFLGEVRVFSFNFNPTGWFQCQGQLLAISQYTALFSILGTTYGGNGVNNFALPDFRGRVPIHQEGGVYDLGQAGGAESVTLLQTNMPQHTHSLGASSGGATTQNPSGAFLAQPARSGPEIYDAEAPTVALAGASIGAAGGSVPVSTLQPTVVLNFCIAFQGIFPSRN